MSVKPILYTYFRSSCSWRVRIALAFKGIDYDQKAIHLIKDGGEQNSAEFKAINPMAQIPALNIDGHLLIQSASILEYLEETRPSPALLPTDPFQRATIRSICECIGSGIQPMQNTSTQNYLDKSIRQEWVQFWLSKGLAALEVILEKTAGKYSVGDDVTLADCYLVPQVYSAERFKVDLTPYPTVTRVAAALEKLDPFVVSHAQRQPDCPEELRQ